MARESEEEDKNLNLKTIIRRKTRRGSYFSKVSGEISGAHSPANRLQRRLTLHMNTIENIKNNMLNIFQQKEDVINKDIVVERV